MTQTKKIAIIILTYNGKEDTLECLESVSKINYKNFKTFVVDNNPSDDSVKCIEEKFKNSITLIKNPNNDGFAEGNNAGIREALKDTFDYFFLLNNDTIVDPNILDELVFAADKKPNFGILGPKSLYYDNRDVIDHCGGFWNQKNGDFKSLDQGTFESKHTNEMKEVDEDLK